MKDLVLYLVKSLADHPEKVSAEESDQNGTLRVQLTIAEEDKGKIIGKQGKVIKAIRALVGVAAAKAGVRTVVEID